MTPYYSSDRIEIYNANAFDVLPQIETGSMDAVITDPPYGVKIDSWDRGLTGSEIQTLTEEVKRISNGFYAVFGQLPSAHGFITEAISNGMHFCEHVVWVKRVPNPSVRLGRTHESVFIYATGKRKRFYRIKGPFEDVKTPGILFDVATIEGIMCHIKDLHRKIKSDIGSDITADRGRYDSHYNRLTLPSSERSPRDVNYTNVWSFLPDSKRNRMVQSYHPCQKPINIMSRLIEMLAPENGVIIDPFMGSGSTLIAAARLGCKAIGIELDKQYCDIAIERIEKRLDKT